MPFLPPTSRRAFLSGVAAAAASATVMPASAASLILVRGTVFHDRAATGRRRSQDPGIGGVLISNGVDIVSTRADGSWELPVTPDQFVFVIKPSGWSCPNRDDGRPLFFVRAADPNCSIDFPLVKVNEAAKFDVLLLADTQPHDAREIDFLRDTIMTDVMAQDAVFAINHGDIVFDDPALYRRYLALTAATGMPWHHCPGNHDMNFAAESGDALAVWKQVFGPCHYAFQYAGSTFVILNNVEPSPGVGGYGYRGAIGQHQLQFVRNLLACVPKDQLVVFSMHIPVASFEDPHDPSGTTHDRDLLLDAIAAHPHCLSLSGHSHTTEHHYLDLPSGCSGQHHHHVLTAACGSWWSGPYTPEGQPVADSRDGTPKGFHVLTVDGNAYTTRFVPVGHGGHPTARIKIAPTSLVARDEREPANRHSVKVAELRDLSLFVNVFDGGPRTKVTCRWPGNAEESMILQREPIADPYTIETYARHRRELKSWVEPSISSHLWRAPLPKALPAGVHKIAVTVQDEYGRSVTVDSLVEVQH